MQVAQQLTNEVLTPRSQQAKVLGVNKVSADQPAPFQSVQFSSQRKAFR